jgi:hypothetical protein
MRSRKSNHGIRVGLKLARDNDLNIPRVFFQNMEDLVHELVVRLAVLHGAIWHKLRNQVFECGSLPFFSLK